MIMGDMHCILNGNEGWPPVVPKDDDFEELQAGTRDCGLIDMAFVGMKLTWNNSQKGEDRVEKKLDRFMVNDLWLDQFTDIQAVFDLPRFSDHSPTYVSFWESG